MTARPKLKFTLLTLAACALSTPPASACSCRRGDDARQQIILQEMLREPGAVLAEVDVGGSTKGATGGEDTSFKVFSAWAGSPPEALEVHHNTRGAACGLEFQQGDRLLLLATAPGGVLMTSQCSQRLASFAKGWGKARVRELAKGDK